MILISFQINFYLSLFKRYSIRNTNNFYFVSYSSVFKILFIEKIKFLQTAERQGRRKREREAASSHFTGGCCPPKLALI